MFLDTLFTYSFYAIIAYWIVTHGPEFGTAIASMTAAIQSGTRSLWGFN